MYRVFCTGRWGRLSSLIWDTVFPLSMNRLIFICVYFSKTICSICSVPPCLNSKLSVLYRYIYNLNKSYHKLNSRMFNKSCSYLWISYSFQFEIRASHSFYICHRLDRHIYKPLASWFSMYSIAIIRSIFNDLRCSLHFLTNGEYQ